MVGARAYSDLVESYDNDAISLSPVQSVAIFVFIVRMTTYPLGVGENIYKRILRDSAFFPSRSAVYLLYKEVMASHGDHLVVSTSEKHIKTSSAI